MKTIVQRAFAEPWAITAEGLELVLSVAARENQASIEALEAYRARHVPTAERLTKRGPVAILSISGPMFRHANMFTAVSGATSYEVLRRDLQAALDEPSLRALLLNFDTPGGEVSGVDELAKAIRAGKARKPIVAYVGGSAASAGYWMGSQATEIVVAETAMLGSIGVRAVVQDTTEADAKAGRIEFISSQSPGKRADVSSDEGRGRIQRTIDAMADVFIATVAEGRGVKADDVIAKFGGGDVLIGRAAVAAGMADRIGDFEAVVAELAGRTSSAPLRSVAASAATLPERQPPAATMELPAARAETAEIARARIRASWAKALSNVSLAAGLSAEAGEQGPNPATSQDPNDAIGAPAIINPGEGKPKSSAEKAKAGWAKAIATVNARIK